MSIPWKGLVIGTSTHNYPLGTKQSTLTNHIVDFKNFMEAKCESKSKIAKKKKIDYVYSPKFDCEGFELRGISGEGLHLYEVV